MRENAAGECPNGLLRKRQVPSGARRRRLVQVHVRYRRLPRWRRHPESGATRSLRHSANPLSSALSQTSGRQNTPKMYNWIGTRRRNVQFGGSTRLGMTIWSPSRLICTGNVLSGRHSPLKHVIRSPGMPKCHFTMKYGCSRLHHALNTSTLGAPPWRFDWISAIFKRNPVKSPRGCSE